MHSKYSEVFSGRIEFLLSPDDMYQPMSQKARQELWKRIQDAAREIDRQDLEINQLREELTKTRKQFD